MRIDGAGIGALGRFSVSAKFRSADLIGKFLPFGLKINFYPTNMMFGFIRMEDFFTHGNRDPEKLTLIYNLRRFDNRNMFFCFPVRTLQQVFKIRQVRSP